jgi:hypothetical protein
MKNRISILIAAISAIGISGCTTVATKPLSSPSTNATHQDGIAYHLPKGQIRLMITETDGTLKILLGGVSVVADSDMRLISKLPHSAIADNNVTISVATETNLLDKVEVTSTGRVDDIIEDLAKSSAIAQGSLDRSEHTIFDHPYDVSDVKSAQKEANAFLATMYRELCVKNRANRATTPNAKGSNADADKVARSLRCGRLELAGVNASDSIDYIKIDIIPIGQPRTSPAQPESEEILKALLPDCLRGICYRPLIPVMLRLSVNGVFDLQDRFLMPDPDNIIFVDLASGVFATQTYKLGFTNGILTSYQQDAKSEFAEFVKLPIKVFGAIVAAPGVALGLKQKALSDQAAYLAAVSAVVKAKDTARTDCKNAPGQCPSATYKIIGGPISAATQPSKPKNEGGGQDNDTPVGPQ